MHTGQKVITILAAGGVLGFVYAKSLAESTKFQKKTPTVLMSRPVHQSDVAPKILTISGKFLPKVGASIPLGRLDSGSRVKLFVRVNDRVQKGQLLAVSQFSSAGQQKVPRFSQQSEAASAEQLSNDLGQALKQYEKDIENATQRLTEARKQRVEKIAMAQAEYSKVSTESRSAAIQEAESHVTVAQQAYDKAKKLADRDAHAYEEGWIARNQATASQKASLEKEQILDNAKSRLEEAKSSVSEQDTKAAKSKFEAVRNEENAKVRAAEEQLELATNQGLAFQDGNSIPAGVFAIPQRGFFAGKVGRQTELRAPVSGTVTTIFNKQVKSILDLAPDGEMLEFVAAVKEEVASLLRVGSIVHLSEQESATVTRIDAFDPQSRTSTIHVLATGVHKKDEMATVSFSIR